MSRDASKRKERRIMEEMTKPVTQARSIALSSPDKVKSAIFKNSPSQDCVLLGCCVCPRTSNGCFFWFEVLKNYELGDRFSRKDKYLLISIYCSINLRSSIGGGQQSEQARQHSIAGEQRCIAIIGMLTISCRCSCCCEVQFDGTLSTASIDRV